MSISRAALVQGPAKVVRGSGILFSQDDIAVNIVRNTFDVATDGHGKIEERESDLTVECTFTPDGRWDAATRALLWPYASTLPGTSLFGSSDTPLTLNAADGALHTLVASALTRMPNIVLSSVQTMIGQCQFMGVRSNDTDWSDTDSLYTTATGALFTDATFAPTTMIKTQDYTGVWGAVTGFGGIQTEAGWTIEFDLQIAPRSVDALGIVDYRFQSLGVMARCVPIGPTPAQILTQLKIQGTGAVRGRSLAYNTLPSTADDLVITGADGSTIITLKQAGLKTAGFRFGATVLRENEIGFVAAKPFASGVPGALFTLA